MTDCPHCGNPSSRIVTTIPDKQNRNVRRRECKRCKEAFHTIEVLPQDPVPFRPKIGLHCAAPPNTHPAILLISEVMRTTTAKQPDIAAAAGVVPNTISRWMRGRHAPSLMDIEAVLNVCGYTLAPVKLEDDNENR